MGIMVLGLNHRTTPVELREQLAFSREGAAGALMLFKEQFPGSEAALLSTCNRVELLVSVEEGSAVGEADLVRFLSRARNVPAAAFSNYLYFVQGRAAVRHMFRVISGLDSMVLGESQIVNQLKTAYQSAHEQGTAGAILHRLFHHAFSVSKRVRSETGIGDGKTSVSSVAVDVIRQKLPEYAGKRILIVGAGEMAQLTAQHLKAAEAKQIVVTTRTLQNARVLAEACGGEAAPFAELDEELVDADVVITSTTCPTAILTVGRVRRAMLRRGDAGGVRPLMLVDLAVPRNVDAEVSEIEGVTLYDVDALGNIVERFRQQRASAVESGESIVEEEVEGFGRWVAQSKVGPLIERMYEDVRALAEIEVRGMLRKCPDLTEAQRVEVKKLVDRVVAKLMHPCVDTIREAEAAGPAVKLADAFHLTRLNVMSKAEAMCSAGR
jgi:glutamyl-tRNA reductase